MTHARTSELLAALMMCSLLAGGCASVESPGGSADAGVPSTECEVGATRSCYESWDVPPDGCSWGQQTCQQDGWDACTGAVYPALGEETCCELSDSPVHDLYEAYQAAYPGSEMPHSLGALGSFLPNLPESPMQYNAVNPGNEYIDWRLGGVSDQNVLNGLTAVRDKAAATIPATSQQVHEVTSEVGRIAIGAGANGCVGVGWAWGSIIYRNTDRSVREILYLYVGFCNYVADTPQDGEAFFYSAQPMTLCNAPVVD